MVKKLDWHSSVYFINLEFQNAILFVVIRFRFSIFDIQTDIVYQVHKPTIKAHAEVTRWSRRVKLYLSLHLHLYLVYARNEGSGESAHMPRLT